MKAAWGDMNMTDTDKLHAVFGTTQTLAKHAPVQLILSLCLLGVLGMESYFAKEEAKERERLINMLVNLCQSERTIYRYEYEDDRFPQ